jgi:hypothetical protein
MVDPKELSCWYCLNSKQKRYEWHPRKPELIQNPKQLSHEKMVQLHYPVITGNAKALQIYTDAPLIEREVELNSLPADSCCRSQMQDSDLKFAIPDLVMWNQNFSWRLMRAI